MGLHVCCDRENSYLKSLPSLSNNRQKLPAQDWNIYTETLMNTSNFKVFLLNPGTTSKAIAIVNKIKFCFCVGREQIRQSFEGKSLCRGACLMNSA